MVAVVRIVKSIFATISTLDRMKRFGVWHDQQINKARPGILYLPDAADATLGARRERARIDILKTTAWDTLIWLDDDDYLHPDRVARQVKLLEEHPEAPYTAFTAAHFLDMKTRRLCPFESGGAAPLALTMLRRHVVEAISFDTSLDYGEDTRYMMLVESKFGPGLRVHDPYMTVFGCHPYNVSREARAGLPFTIPLDELRGPLGWTMEDDAALDALVAGF